MLSGFDRFLHHSLEAWRDEPDQLSAVMHLPRQAADLPSCEPAEAESPAQMGDADERTEPPRGSQTGGGRSGEVAGRGFAARFEPDAGASRGLPQ